MKLDSFLLDIVKLTVAGMGVVWIAFYLIKPYLDRNDRTQLIELKKAVTGQTLPLQLQAYERLILFIDRINPANMLLRLNATAYSAADLQGIIIGEIRNEFQHNITQQLYVTPGAWAVVKRIKDDTQSIVINAIKALPEGASGLDLSKTILSHLTQLEQSPYDIAAAVIREQTEQLF